MQGKKPKNKRSSKTPVAVTIEEYEGEEYGG